MGSSEEGGNRQLVSRRKEGTHQKHKSVVTVLNLILYIMQARVSEGIASLEKATHLVNQLSLFSSNEAVEEVSTTDLK
jgi:hypothetical protein